MKPNRWLRWVILSLGLLLLAANVLHAQTNREAHRIGIRQMDGNAEFYDTETGERFVPRGANYVDLVETGKGYYQDRVFATNRYDPDRVREAFQRLASSGYNTVRIFFDTCQLGPSCITSVDRQGVNPDYLDNMVDVMRIAADEGIYLLLTSNDIPDGGGYGEMAHRGASDQIAGYRNAHFLTEWGARAVAAYWEAVLSGLATRAAPTEAVLGWQILNEQWFFRLEPPFSLNSGVVTTATGDYDMSDPAQKQRMAEDNILNFIASAAAVIRERDPGTLVTMGFFAPQYPNPTYIGGDWYVETARLLHEAPLDFFDFHAYYDTDLTVEQQAENFGMIGYEEKPIVMGEFGGGKEILPSAHAALEAAVNWIAESCAVGFDGWLNWAYYAWPAAVEGPPWSFLDDGGVLMDGMAPVNQPDPCVVPTLAVSNVASGKPVTASQSLPDQPPEAAVDGGDTPWGAGGDAPQWIEIDLQAPTTVGEVGLIVDQYPDGETRHQVWARLDDGRLILLHEFNEFTTFGDGLRVTLPVPLANVRAVRVLTLASPSWVAWREIDILSAAAAGEDACVVSAGSSVNLRQQATTASPVAGSLAAGQGALVIDRATGDDGFGYWRLPGGVWVREDVVSASGACP